MSFLEFLANHTFRMVFFGTMLIGLVAGALGSFAYLRKQSLSADVIAHSALPGALGMFLLVTVVFEGDGRNMVALLFGAIVSGTLAVLCANFIAAVSKLRIAAAMAVSLSFFFGVGMLLLRVIANAPLPGKGGIQDYLFGNASVVTVADLVTCAVVGLFALVLMLLFWKEFALRTFDSVHGRVLGFRMQLVDALLFVTVALATVIGVKAVGLVLLVAFVVTPPAAARQWVSSLWALVLLSAVFGAVCSGVGAYLSVVLGRVPTGPLIVLLLFGVFVVSLLCAPRRSVVWRGFVRWRLRRGLRDMEGVR